MMRSTLALTSLILVTALLVLAILSYDSNSPASLALANPPNASNLAAIRYADGSHDVSAAAEISELEERLQHEIGARRALEQRVALLTRQVATLLQHAPPAGGGGTTDLTPGSAAGVDPAGSDDWFNEPLLIASGVDRVLAGQLRAHYEQLELERLYLRNQSLRESWNREQLRTALQEIARKESELKDQFGEEAYDAYLYAAGKPNRVAVTSVLTSAQAGEAGIRAGDFIMRYDNQRIYDWFDLQEATAAGEVGEMVSLEVERDGETLQFYLQRGPLGIRMDSVSVGPADRSR